MKPAFLFMFLTLVTASVMAESETIPDAVDAELYTGSYSNAYMPYVPVRFNAYNGGYNSAYNPSAYVPSRFYYHGVPTGGIYMTNRISNRPIFYF